MVKSLPLEEPFSKQSQEHHPSVVPRSIQFNADSWNSGVCIISQQDPLEILRHRNLNNHSTPIAIHATNPSLRCPEGVDLDPIQCCRSERRNIVAFPSSCISSGQACRSICPQNLRRTRSPSQLQAHGTSLSLASLVGVKGNFQTNVGSHFCGSEVFQENAQSLITESINLIQFVWLPKDWTDPCTCRSISPSFYHCSLKTYCRSYLRYTNVDHSFLASLLRRTRSPLGLFVRLILKPSS